MTYFSYFLLLASLASLNLIILILLRIMDSAKVVTNQKIIFIKIGLVIIVAGPCIFALSKMFSWHTLEVMVPGQFSNSLSIPKMSSTLIKHRIDISFYIFVAYRLGFFMMLCRILSSYLIARKQLSSSSPAIIQGESVLLNKHIQSPLSFGLPIAKMYFPSDTEEKWTPREIQMSIAHEKCHVERNDSLWKLLSLLVQALLFFVPWSYSLHRKFELEMEIFCDEKTCIETDADIQEYGCLLLAMTCVQPQNLIFNNITNSTIKRRLLAMKSKTVKRPFLISILSTALLFMGSTAIATTSGAMEKNSVFKITSRIFMNGKLISSPVIITYANQKALIVITNTNHGGSRGLKVALAARDIEKPGRNDDIGINYDIESKTDKEKMYSKPHIIVAPDQEGKISIASDSSHSYEMYVLAERQ